MKRFLYLIGFLVLLLVIKAFYLDPYISEKFADSNQSSESNESVEENTTVTEPSDSTVEKKKAPLANGNSASKEKMPLDKLGDSIADKIEDKIEKR